MSTLITSGQKVLEQFGIDAITKMTDILTASRKVSTGQLIDSLKFRVKRMGQTLTFELEMLEYWKWVDQGRRPGKQPPPQTILDWVKQKPITVQTGDTHIIKSGPNRGKPLKLRAVPEDKKQRSLAFLIGRKIGRFGIKPNLFYTDTINDRSLDKLQKDLAEALRTDVEVLVSATVMEINAS